MTEHEPHRQQAPVRRPGPVTSAGSRGWTCLDLSDEPVLTIEEIEQRTTSLRWRVRSSPGRPRTLAVRWSTKRRYDRQRASRGWTDADVWTRTCLSTSAPCWSNTDGVRSRTPTTWLTTSGGDRWTVAGQRLLAHDPDDERRVAEARIASHWVADNLIDLWD